VKIKIEPDMNINSSKSSNEVKLSELKEGQTGRIVRVGGQGVLRRRLLEMGLIKGTQVYVEKYAPLKDPIELIVKGYHVSLRVEEAAQVILEKIRQELTDGSEAN
jgi:Fe2+ transport system protein FeoA